MLPEVHKLPFDMHSAVLGIEMFVEGKTLDDLKGDLMLRSAVERQFEILGEALNRLRKVDTAIADSITELRGIISFRNVLIQGYDSTDQAITWRIITDKLPVLKRELTALLS